MEPPLDVSRYSDGPPEYPIWLVVTGTWLDYDFPFSWEFHKPN